MMLGVAMGKLYLIEHANSILHPYVLCYIICNHHQRENNMPEKDEPENTFFEFIKKLWIPVAGFIGAVLLIYQLIQIWKGDTQTVTWVIAIAWLIVWLIFLGWVGFSKATSVRDNLSASWTSLRNKTDLSSILAMDSANCINHYACSADCRMVLSAISAASGYTRKSK